MIGEIVGVLAANQAGHHDGIKNRALESERDGEREQGNDGESWIDRSPQV